MDVERAAKLLERYQRDTGLFKKRAAQVGDNNPSDTPVFRDKIGQLRNTILKTETELQGALQNAPSPGQDRSWDQIRNTMRDYKKEFEQADANERRREKMFPLGASSGMAAANDSGSKDRVGGQLDLSQLQRVDMSELATEENIQTEKHRAAREIEQEAAELHGAYVEFNALTKEQQIGIDKMSGNVTRAQTHVERGVGQLQQASKAQKSGKKMMCIAVIILTVVLAIVVIVVVVMKK